MKKGATILVLLVIVFIAFFLIVLPDKRVEVPPFPESAGEGLGYVIAENGDSADFAETINGQSVIHLDSGWNMISFSLNPVQEAEVDRSITLQPGWNLIGYSSSYKDSLNQELIEIDNEPIEKAVEKGVIQNQFAYYESNEDVYKLVPSQNSHLRSNRAYWVYSNKREPINMKFKGAGGSLDNASVNVDDLIFVNNESEEMSFRDARREWSIQIRKYDSSAQGFVPVNDGESINAWEGYFINSRDEGISIKVN